MCNDIAVRVLGAERSRQGAAGAVAFARMLGAAAWTKLAIADTLE